MKNRNFAKLENNALAYAPSALTIDGYIVTAPTVAQYAAAGWLPVIDEPPTPPEGQEAVPTGYALSPSGESIVRVYALRPLPPPRLYISKSKVERVIDEMGLTSAFSAWLNSRAAYFGAWMRGGDEVEYDPAANGSDLASLLAALGIPQGEVPALIERVVA